MKKIIVSILLITAGYCCQAQTNDEYTQTLKKMYDISGQSETFKVVIKQMMGAMKNQYPDLPSSFWSGLEKEFLSTSIDDLAGMLAPVYKKYLSVNDLQAIIAFYESPTGQKFAKSTPLITQESMEVGQKWGMKIGQEVAQKVMESQQQKK